MTNSLELDAFKLEYRSSLVCHIYFDLTWHIFIAKSHFIFLVWMGYKCLIYFQNDSAIPVLSHSTKMGCQCHKARTGKTSKCMQVQNLKIIHILKASKLTQLHYIMSLRHSPCLIWQDMHSNCIALVFSKSSIVVVPFIDVGQCFSCEWDRQIWRAICAIDPQWDATKGWNTCLIARLFLLPLPRTQFPPNNRESSPPPPRLSPLHCLDPPPMPPGPFVSLYPPNYIFQLQNKSRLRPCLQLSSINILCPFSSVFVPFYYPDICLLHLTCQSISPPPPPPFFNCSFFFRRRKSIALIFYLGKNQSVLD